MRVTFTTDAELLPLLPAATVYHADGQDIFFARLPAARVMMAYAVMPTT